MSVLSRPWQFSQPGAIGVGSEAHKTLFCRMLLETHDPYEPATLAWPQLDSASLARLTGLPFWDVAVDTEDRAGAHIAQFAKSERDPLIREALELMAAEEVRHRRLLEVLVQQYGIRLAEKPPYVPPANARRNFMATGYGECLDSFFAFGLFALARQSGFFPGDLVEVFEPVIQEEARHLLFFVNWCAYTQANLPAWARIGFMARRLWSVAENAYRRVGLARPEGDVQFAAEGRESIGVDISMRAFIELCLSENERRMARFDARLLRPAIMPKVARCIRPFAPRS